MITYADGSLFDSPAQTLACPVNTVGVMGAGLALAFKRRYSDSFTPYRNACADGLLRPGVPWLYERPEAPHILHFPTKRHWREPSDIGDISQGLAWVRENQHRFVSLALPALGCGLGGLAWADVRERIERHLGNAPLPVFVYTPAVRAGLE